MCLNSSGMICERMKKKEENDTCSRFVQRATRISRAECLFLHSKSNTTSGLKLVIVIWSFVDERDSGRLTQIGNCAQSSHN